MNSLVRQLKLHALVGEKASAEPRVGLIVAFFDKLFDRMVIEVIPDHNKESVIFHKDGKFYMEQDLKNDWLLCRREDYWLVLEDEFGLTYDETRVVVKYMVEKHLKQQVGTPRCAAHVRLFGVEKHLKQQVGTPLGYTATGCSRVEKHLKQQVGTPIDSSLTEQSEAEKHLKQQVGTPISDDGRIGNRIELFINQ